MYVCLYTHKLHLLSHLYNSPICRVIFFFSHLERSMALQIPMAGVMPDILERVLFGGLERLGRKGWGMEGETKKPMALKEVWSRLIFFFSKASHFFIQQHSSIFFPRLAIPHKKYKPWHVGASNKLPWGPTKLTKGRILLQASSLTAKLLMFWFWSPFFPS